MHNKTTNCCRCLLTRSLITLLHPSKATRIPNGSINLLDTRKMTKVGNWLQIRIDVRYLLILTHLQTLFRLPSVFSVILGYKACDENAMAGAHPQILNLERDLYSIVLAGGQSICSGPPEANTAYSSGWVRNLNLKKQNYSLLPKRYAHGTVKRPEQV